MAIVPPPEAISAIESGSAEIIRRLEIYETDGVTPWYPDGDQGSRFLTGGVSIDANRDERRTVDLSLLNHDNALRPDPNGGLWYDKVFKLFRGIKYRTANKSTLKLVIVDDDATTMPAQTTRAELVNLGFPNVDIKLGAITYEDVSTYDIIVSATGDTGVTFYAILNAAYQAGKAVVTITTKPNSTAGQIPWATNIFIDLPTTTHMITPVTTNVPVTVNWVNQTSSLTRNRNQIRAVDSTAIPIATQLAGGQTFYTGVLAENNNGGRWFHMGYPEFNVQSRKLLGAGVTWLRGQGVQVEEFSSWETQIGEFVIDNISEENFPPQVKVTGRDYSKRCLNSKLQKAIAFEAGTDVRTLIVALAANAGINKMKIPVFSEALGQRLDFAPGTSRWEVMKQVANAFGYNIFFDAQGYLTMRVFQDPSFTAVVATFKTGEDGNLVRYSHSINDSFLYNHIIVSAPVEGENGIPYFGEAKNTEPGSASSIERIGDRSYFIENPVLSSDEACVKYARAELKYWALESYEFSFESICFPWMDVGEICDLFDPRALPHEPTRYLMDSIQIPMSLGPMSLTAKRVTFVADKEAEAVA